MFSSNRWYIFLLLLHTVLSVTFLSVSFRRREISYRVHNNVLLHFRYGAGGFGRSLGAGLAAVGGHEESEEDKVRHVPVPVHKTLHIPVAHPVAVPVHQQLLIRVPHPVAVHVPVHIPVVNNIPVPVEKHVPIVIHKPIPIHIEKKIPFPVLKPYPVPFPITKVKHHYAHSHHWGKSQLFKLTLFLYLSNGFTPFMCVVVIITVVILTIKTYFTIKTIIVLNILSSLPFAIMRFLSYFRYENLLN